MPQTPPLRFVVPGVGACNGQRCTAIHSAWGLAERARHLCSSLDHTLGLPQQDRQRVRSRSVRAVRVGRAEQKCGSARAVVVGCMRRGCGREYIGSTAPTRGVHARTLQAASRAAIHGGAGSSPSIYCAGAPPRSVAGETIAPEKGPMDAAAASASRGAGMV
jgi:hypothetical protein